MKIGDQTREVISRRKKRYQGKHQTAMVIYKTFLGKWNGKARYHSVTRHEVVA